MVSYQPAKSSRNSLPSLLPRLFHEKTPDELRKSPFLDDRIQAAYVVGDTKTVAKLKDSRKMFIYAGIGLGVAAAIGGSAAVYWYLKSPPEIENYRWTPTKEKNSKVYEGNISFDAKTHFSPASATLEIAPVIPPEWSPEDIPQQGSQTFTVKPVKSVGGIIDKIDSFSQNVALKGGTTYQANVTVTDHIGNQRRNGFDIPYIREFESTAGLDGINVIADYYTWYKKPWSPHAYQPLNGEYDSSDTIVIAKQIDQASGHGIDAFAVSWWGKDLENPNRQITGAHPHDMINFENSFLEHPMLSQIKFCILYENNGRLRIQNPSDPPEKWIQDLDDPFNRERLISDFEYLTRYFSSPQYLTVDDGKLYVRFDYTLPFRGDVKGAFNELRDKVRQNGRWELYLANDLAGRSFYPNELISGKVSYPPNLVVSPVHIKQIIESTDTFSGSSPPPYYEMDVEGTYKMWHDFALGCKKDLVPFAWPGYHNLSCTTCKSVGGSAEHFMTLLKAAMKQNTKKVIEIPYNEWIAGIQTEPAIQYGFAYLNTLQNSLDNI